MSPPREIDPRWLSTPWGTAQLLQGESLCSGEQALLLIDTHGMPLDILLDIFVDRRIVIDTVGFIEYALKSGNYTLGSLKKKMCLQASVPETFFDACVKYLFLTGRMQ